MRFIYLILVVLLLANLLIVTISGILNINIYKLYGVQILKAFFKFLLTLAIFYIAIAISSLGS